MRQLRNKDPKIFRLITIRTCQAQLWITPSSNVRKLVGGIIARYQELFSVELFAYCVLGNHYHLLARAPKGNIDEFCENVNREIARRINWKHKREGKFWARRYDDQEVLSEDDLLEAFLYINTNPTRHGLVEDSSQWPGLISFDQSLKGNARRFSFQHYTEGYKVTSHKLKLGVLPQFKHLRMKARREKLKALLKERQVELAKERGTAFLGLKKLLDLDAGAMPMRVSRSPRPSCYTKLIELRREFNASERLRRASYQQASARYRLGLDADFPEHTFKPPLHRLPRIIPFKPLTQDHFKNAA